MGTQLNELLTKMNANGSLTETEKNKVRALSSQLASQTGGAKKIYEALRDKGGPAAQLMGEYMANNSKVRQALEGKSQRTASRVADIASGAIDANMTQEAYDRMNNQYLAYQRQQVALGQQAVSEAEWRAGEAAAGRTVDETTVVQNIARNVLDKDKDFVTQSGAEVSELVRHISPERINRMAANATTLFGYGDVAEGVQNTIIGMAARNGGGGGGAGRQEGDFGGEGTDIPRGSGSDEAMDSEGDSSAYVSYEFLDDGNISAAKQHMIQSFFGNTTAPSLSSRTKNKFGSDYKKNSFGAAAMFSDFARGDFSRANMFHQVQELNNDGTTKMDASGAPVTHFASSYYSGSGLSGVNSMDLSKLKPHHLSNVLDGIRNQTTSAGDALDVMRAADDVLAHPEQFPTDADSKAYIRRIRDAVIASDQKHAGTGRSTNGCRLRFDQTSCA